MTFEDLQKANDAVCPIILEKVNKKTGEVSRKEYTEVHQRIKAFRMCYPEGFITTEMLSNVNGVCYFKATAGYRDNGQHIVLGTGHAYEKEGSTFINQTSYVEVAETSAVGRALGMCGFGIDTSVASAEEVQNAIANQSKPEPKKDPYGEEEKATPEQISIIASVYRGENLTKLCAAYGISGLDEMPRSMAAQYVAKIEERRNKNNG